MITDVDVKKLKTVFATKEALKALDLKVDFGFAEIITFIGETKNEIVKELHDFRDEVRVMNRNSQSTLNNHESRIAHLEYMSK